VNEFSVGDRVRTTKAFEERYGYSLSGEVNMVHISDKNRLNRSHRVTLDVPLQHRPNSYEFRQAWLDPEDLELDE
jgi:hypothetical protein